MSKIINILIKRKVRFLDKRGSSSKARLLVSKSFNKKKQQRIHLELNAI